METSSRLTVGFIINPYAGIGGALALKGSDGADIREKALAAGAEKKAARRAETALELLQPYKQLLHFVTADNEMGANSLEALGFSFDSVYKAAETPSSDWSRRLQHQPFLAWSARLSRVDWADD